MHNDKRLYPITVLKIILYSSKTYYNFDLASSYITEVVKFKLEHHKEKWLRERLLEKTNMRKVLCYICFLISLIFKTFYYYLKNLHTIYLNTIYLPHSFYIFLNSLLRPLHVLLPQKKLKMKTNKMPIQQNYQTKSK